MLTRNEIVEKLGRYILRYKKCSKMKHLFRKNDLLISVYPFTIKPKFSSVAAWAQDWRTENKLKNGGNFMWRYIVKRVLWLIPSLLAVSLIICLLAVLTPGEPARIILGNEATDADIERFNHDMGLDKPFFEQYMDFIKGILHGDLGTSYVTGNSITDEIKIRFPYTLRIAFIGMVLSVLIGVPLGVFAATHQYTWKDNISMFLSLFCVSMPGFWFALVLVQIFSKNLGWLPSMGVDHWYSYILPCITVAVAEAASLARQSRSSMLEVIRQDYITTARAKGVAESKVIYKHALKNALMPVITLVATGLASSMGGAIVAETIFSIPGMGSYVVRAVNQRDYGVVKGTVVLLAFIFAFCMLLIDLGYAFVDPRIRSQYARKRTSRRKQTEKEN